jgi:triosephosphate isomerase
MPEETNMPVPMLAANWKMNCLADESAELARAVVEGCTGLKGRDVLLAVPYTSLHVVARELADSSVSLAAQDMFWEKSGAWTGEVSAEMLVDAGCSHVVIGHSERREHFGETDYSVARKVAAAHAGGLIPLLCVGETLDQREAGQTAEVVEKQLRGGLCELELAGFTSLLLAYEPVWAIGTGHTASSEQAEEVHAGLRTVLADMSDTDTAAGIRILYGGSVKPDNVDELMTCPNVNGALVGGASLKAEDFLRIVHHREQSGVI